MAHSWIMAHESEEAAFQTYADIYPDKTVFLIDTYDTLKSGIPNAIKVGRKLVEQGKNFGVRLDSGDIHYLSVEARKLLDAAGLPQATISVSNDLDEFIIQNLTNAEAPINTWGVGTQMVTGGTDAAFTGVYKLAVHDDGAGNLVPAIKFSNTPEKTTNPAVKQVWRIRDAQGMALADVLGIDDPANPDSIERGERYAFWHTSTDYRHFYHTVEGSVTPLLSLRMKRGKLVSPQPSLQAIRSLVRNGLDSFDNSYKRILNPHIYKVSMTERLRNLKLELIKTYQIDSNA
jgi:nicotinate phosphoribosyltransferase